MSGLEDPNQTTTQAILSRGETFDPAKASIRLALYLPNGQDFDLVDLFDQVDEEIEEEAEGVGDDLEYYVDQLQTQITALEARIAALEPGAA